MNGKVVYLDNNASTFMTDEAIAEITKWFNRGNPGADYMSAKAAQNMMHNFRAEIAKTCEITLDDWDFIFTSGASESNSMILTMTTRAMFARSKKKPHVIISNVEHKSVTLCCDQMMRDGVCDVTVLPVMRHRLGDIDPQVLAEALRPNTALVSVVAANGETGIINSLKSLAVAAHQRGVPLHTDCVQTFGKEPLKPDRLGVDAFSVSFHKLYGPIGVGLLAVRKSLVAGYGLAALIAGTQQNHLRGGTENPALIAGARAGFHRMLADRASKNAHMRGMRTTIVNTLTKFSRFCLLSEWSAEKKSQADRDGDPWVVWIAPDDERRVIPNTMLLAVYRRRTRSVFCNRACRKSLERDGIVVSLGAACNVAVASNGVASNGNGVASNGNANNSNTVAVASNIGDPLSVNIALGVPPELSGVVRVSLCDDTTLDDIKKFLRAFVSVINSDNCMMTFDN